jgi:hypothetical protein
MTKKTRQAIIILIADLLTVSTAGFLTGFATTLMHSDWSTAIISFVLAIFNGFATIYFRRQL